MVTTVRVREDRLRPIALRPSAGENRLRRITLAVGAAGLVQAVAVAVVAPDTSLPVTATGATGRIGAEPVARALVAVPVAVAAASVLALPAAAHVLAASRWGFPGYIRGLRRHDGGHRRLPAALGVPAMVAAIALRAGVSDLAAVLALAGSGLVAATLGPPPAGAATTTHRRAPPVVAAWVGAVALPWLALGAHLAAGDGPPEPVAGAVALVVLGAGCAVVPVVVGSVGGWRRSAGWHRGNGGEAVALGFGLVACSLVAWLLVATTGSP